MKKIISISLFISLFLITSTGKALAVESTFVPGNSETATCNSQSRMLILDLSGFPGCVPYWEDPTSFSVNDFDISDIPDSQNLNTVTVKFWVNNTNNDNSVHYIPELHVTNSCIVSAAAVEPTTTAWQIITRTFDISSCHLTSSTDSVEKVLITRNNTTGGGAIDYISLNVTYSPSFDLRDKSSNGNNLLKIGVNEVTSSLPFTNSIRAGDWERSNNDYMQASDSAGLDLSGDLTLEAWVKLESTGNFMSIISKVHPTNNPQLDTNYNYLLGVYNNGAVYFGVGNLSTNASIIGDSILSTEIWYHIAGVISGNSMKIYINGNLDKSDTKSITQSTNSGVLSIGAVRQESGNVTYAPFDGQIDEVRIWNTARSNNLIANSRSHELLGSEPGLVAYYPFEDYLEPFNLTLDLTDKTSNHNNLIYGGISKISSSLAILSSDAGGSWKREEFDYLEASDSSSLDLSSDFTLEAWVKSNNLGNFMEVVSKVHPTNNPQLDMNYNYLLAITSTGKVYFGLGNLSTNASFTGSTSLSVGVWYHIAGVVSGNSMEIFVDGVSDGTISKSITQSTNNGLLAIGAARQTTDDIIYAPFDGQIDEVRIWSLARTQTQINTNKTSELTGSQTGLVAYYPLESL